MNTQKQNDALTNMQIQNEQTQSKINQLNSNIQNTNEQINQMNTDIQKSNDKVTNDLFLLKNQMNQVGTELNNNRNFQQIVIQRDQQNEMKFGTLYLMNQKQSNQLGMIEEGTKRVCIQLSQQMNPTQPLPQQQQMKIVTYSVEEPEDN